MKFCVLLIALLACPALGHTITGKVETIDKDHLQIKNQDGMLTLRIDERTTVRKGRVLNDLSAIKAGDEIRATCYGEGTLTAVDISAMVTFSGVITETSPAHIKVIPDSTNENATLGKSTSIFVFLNQGAKSGMNLNRLVVGH